MVVALRACRWSEVVHLRVACRFLGVGVVLGLVVYGRSRGWAQAAVRVGFGVVLGSATGGLGVQVVLGKKGAP